MAANVGAKIFRDFFRDSPCRMAYLLKPVEASAPRLLSSKIVVRPKTAPNPRINRTTDASSVSLVSARPVSRFDRYVEPATISKPSTVLSKQPCPPCAKIKKNSTTDSKSVRKDTSKKHRTSSSGSVGQPKILNTVQKRDPQPRKPGCKVCLPNDPTGFLLSEIDHIRDRILDRPDSISCRQAIALAQDIRNRVDAIVLPAGSNGERETRVKFIGGRVESFGKIPDQKRRSITDTDRNVKRAKIVLDKKVTSSPLGGWMRFEEERKDIKHERS
ncbi:uncharacterized protein LOC126567255 [Anopheles maculipalpis]|uniref:uncharacterized protein LOC126567255 n=1 Tax=Anopheles maculipalpis TaxID=1496333 RepID=UPI002158D378|nr:uncharacterized protein LOC126567255 [Anopheles maculipalpis]